MLNLGLLKFNTCQAQVSFQLSRPIPEVLLFKANERGVGNCLAILTQEGVVVVDATYSPAGAKEIIRMISEETVLPIRYLINTHWHDDHIWGNQSFKEAFPEISIISHFKTRKIILDKAIPSLSSTISALANRISERDSLIASGIENSLPITEERKLFLKRRQQVFKSVLEEYKSINPTLPDVTFADSLTIILGSTELKLLHLGQGHTEGDIIVYVPAYKLAVLGDLYTRPIPAGSNIPIEEQISTYKKLLDLEVETWIPGHGDFISQTSFLYKYLDMLETLQSLIQEARKKELSLDQCLELVKDNKLGESFTKGDPKLSLAFEQFFLRPILEPIFSGQSN